MIVLLKSVDEPAAVKDGVLLTKKDLCRMAHSWKRSITASKTRRLLLFAEDSVDVLAACLGAWSAGVPTVMLPEASARFARAMAEDGLILDGDCCALQSSGFAGLPTIAPEYDSSAADEDAEVDENADLIVLFTSGSTGRAKLVAKKISQMKAEAEAARTILSDCFTEGRLVEVASTATHQHMYGLSFRFFAPLLIPNALVTNRRLHLAEDVLGGLSAAAASGRRAFLVSTPTHLERITKYADSIPDSIKPCGILSATAPLSNAAASRSRDVFGVDPIEILGSTEIGAMAFRRRSANEDGRWSPFPGLKLSIEDEDGRCRSSGRGRLVLEGDQIYSGFEASADIVELDSGKFMLCGRADRIVKIEGKRFSLDRIESELMKLGVMQARALLVPSRSGRSELCCVLVPTNELSEKILSSGKSSWVRSAKSILSRKLSSLEVPRRYRFASRLPTDESGAQKVTAASLSRLFAESRPDWVPVCDVTADGARTIKAQAVLAPALPWFSGHFESLPILPGVAQLLLAERLFKEYVPTHCSASRIRGLKFKAPIKPEALVELTLSFPVEASDSSSIPLSFEWRSINNGERTSHSSGKIILDDWSRK